MATFASNYASFLERKLNLQFPYICASALRKKRTRWIYRSMKIKYIWRNHWRLMVTLLCLGSVLLVLSHLFENLIFFAPPSLFKLSSSALFGFTNPSLSFSQHGKSMDSSLFLKYSNHHTLGQSIKQNIFAVRDKPRLESLLKKDKIERTS